MSESLALFLLGLAVLAAGAEVLFRAAGRVARSFGANPFVTGTVLRVFAAAAPVLAVGLTAALNSVPGVALGCVIGGNIANIGLTLGLAAVVRPLRARLPLLWTQIPLMVAATLLLWFLSRDNQFSRADGLVLLACFVAWVAYSARFVRGAGPTPDAPPPAGPEWGVRALVVVGLLGLAGGAQLMVAQAVNLHAALRLNEWTVGLTVVAVAAALPGLAVTVRASVRGEADAALATVVGLNLVNILLVLGIVLVVNPFEVRDQPLFRELPAMALFTFLFGPVLLNGLRVSRWEGVVLLLAYAALVGWQVGAFRR